MMSGGETTTNETEEWGRVAVCYGLGLFSAERWNDSINASLWLTELQVQIRRYPALPNTLPNPWKISVVSLETCLLPESFYFLRASLLFRILVSVTQSGHCGQFRTNSTHSPHLLKVFPNWNVYFTVGLWVNVLLPRPWGKTGGEFSTKVACVSLWSIGFYSAGSPFSQPVHCTLACVRHFSVERNYTVVGVSFWIQTVYNWGHYK